MVMVGLVFFLIGALVAALANDFGTLLVGRSFQGIGGGGLIALTEILVTDLVPLRLRGQWFGIISAMWSIGSVSGPIIGGAFAQRVTWVCRQVDKRLVQEQSNRYCSGGSFILICPLSGSPSLQSH